MTEREKQRGETARTRYEIDAIRTVAEQLNATNQMAVGLLGELMRDKIKLARIDAREASLLVVEYDSEGGYKSLGDDVIEQISKLLRLPVICIPRGMNFATVDAKLMEKAGWQRKVVLVGADGNALA